VTITDPRKRRTVLRVAMIGSIVLTAAAFVCVLAFGGDLGLGVWGWGVLAALSVVDIAIAAYMLRGSNAGIDTEEQ
jgi:hypothetical protein